MPYANEIDEKLARVLLYGNEKTKKTWWACRAAELGFNVLLIDGDDGSHIVRQLPLEAQKRILVVNAVDTAKNANFMQFMVLLSKPNNKFIWDEQDKKAVFTNFNPEHSYVSIDVTKLNANDVIIMDSWTSLAHSSLFQFALEQQIDLGDAEKTEWAGYGFQANWLNYVLAQIHKFSCHVIVIGHATVYEKWKGKGPLRELVSSTTQPISSSGPHAKVLGKHFSDIFFFKRWSPTAYKIDTGGDDNTVGGSRHFPPKVYEWDKLTPKELFDALGSVPTKEPSEAFKWFAPGVDPSFPVASKATPLPQIAKTSNPIPATSVTSAPAIENYSVLARLQMGAKK